MASLQNHLVNRWSLFMGGYAPRF